MKRKSYKKRKRILTKKKYVLNRISRNALKRSNSENNLTKMEHGSLYVLHDGLAKKFTSEKDRSKAVIHRDYANKHLRGWLEK